MTVGSVLVTQSGETMISPSLCAATTGSLTASWCHPR